MKLGPLCALIWRYLARCSRKQVILKARHIHGRLNVIADKLSRLGQTIQTEWSLHPNVFKAICCWWPPDSTTTVCLTSSGPPGMGSGCTQPVMGGSGPIRLPTSSHFGQCGGKVAGLPVQQDDTDYTRVAQHALVLGSSGHVQSDLSVPAKPAQSGYSAFNQTLHRTLSNLNLHAWLQEPQLSRSRASLRQWQYELKLLKEDQPDQSMRQSGPFLQSGASVIRWTSGHHL